MPQPQPVAFVHSYQSPPFVRSTLVLRHDLLQLGRLELTVAVHDGLPHSLRVRIRRAPRNLDSWNMGGDHCTCEHPVSTLREPEVLDLHICFLVLHRLQAIATLGRLSSRRGFGSAGAGGLLFCGSVAMVEVFGTPNKSLALQKPLRPVADADENEKAFGQLLTSRSLTLDQEPRKPVVIYFSVDP
jgi:hypothetical protein